VEKIAYGGWSNCLRLSNGVIDIIATTDVGPRIIRYGLVGKENEFFEDPNQMGKTGGTEWMGFGGHRLWLAPESAPRSYYPDNNSIEYEMDGDTLRLLPEMESSTRMQKEIDITLDTNSSHVTVVHKITNHNLWDITMAPWALSVMTAGGEAIFPQEPYAPHPAVPDFPGQKTDQRYFLPVRNIVLWSYTKLNDPRYDFTAKYLILKQDPKAEKPQKIGLSNELGWAAYARNGHLFVKKVAVETEKTYPDNGCVFESFTNADMLELESLGPIVTLKPGATVTHTEDWYLFDNVNFDNTDDSIDTNILSKIKSIFV
jgi:hypothetical protein